MPVYLLTIENTQRNGAELAVTPPVSVKDLAERAPDLMMPMPGDPLELRFPDGSIRAARVASFGVETWSQEGELYTAANPADPACTLSIWAEPAGNAGGGLPRGTEVWLTPAQ